VYASERRLLLLQVSNKIVNISSSAFDYNFNVCIASISHVANQVVFNGCPVNKRSEPHALHDAVNFDFSSHFWSGSDTYEELLN
jgi:hypothetical protein